MIRRPKNGKMGTATWTAGLWFVIFILLATLAISHSFQMRCDLILTGEGLTHLLFTNLEPRIKWDSEYIGCPPQEVLTKTKIWYD